MNDWTDREIFKAVRQGDKSALSILFNRFYHQLKHYGISISQDYVLSEECIQEMFIYIFESHARLSDVQGVKSYLFTGLRRRLITALKQRRALHQKDSEAMGWLDIQFAPQDIQFSKEDRRMSNQALITALNNLPQRQREAIYLKYYNNLSTKDISDVMGVANQTILNMLYQGLQRIRKDDSLSRLSLN